MSEENIPLTATKKGQRVRLRLLAKGYWFVNALSSSYDSSFPEELTGVVGVNRAFDPPLTSCNPPAGTKKGL